MAGKKSREKKNGGEKQGRTVKSPTKFKHEASRSVPVRSMMQSSKIATWNDMDRAAKSAGKGKQVAQHSKSEGGSSSVQNLPPRPNVLTMHTWSVEEYGRYDEFLIKKWAYFGWDDNDNGYVSIRSKNSKVSWVAETIYSQPPPPGKKK